jgi:gas vesicle protein
MATIESIASESLTQIINQLRLNKDEDNENAFNLESAILAVNESIQDLTEYVVVLIDDLSLRWKQQQRIRASEQMDLLEALRERGTTQVPEPQEGPAPIPAQESTPDLDLGILGGFAAAAGAITGALQGLTVGYVTAITDIAKSLGKTIKERLRLDKVFKPLTDVFDLIKNKFSQVKLDLATKLEDFAKSFSDLKQRIITPIKEFGTKVSKFFKPIIEPFQELGQALKELNPSQTDDAGKAASKLDSLLKVFKESLAKVGRVFSALGKIFLPLEIAFRSFFGAQEEIDALGEEASIASQIAAGIEGVFKGVLRTFTSFFDFLKDISSWLLEKLGFDEAASWLDSFNLQEIGDQLLDRICNWIWSFRYN